MRNNLPGILTITRLVRDAYEHARISGFHDDTPDLQTAERWQIDQWAGQKIALMHSELSEALEELRDGSPLTNNHSAPGEKPEGLPSELADVIIRIADFCGAVGIDLEDAVAEKLEYNAAKRRGEQRHGRAF